MVISGKAVSAGDFSFYSIGRGLYYNQTGGGAPLPKTPYAGLFTAEVVPVANRVTSVAVTLPTGGHVFPLHSLGQPYFSWGRAVDPGDTNRIADVFVRDLQSATTTLVSVGAISTNNPPMGASESPGLTPDGRYVVFFSTATNLLGDAPPGGDVYVRDLAGGTTTWVSVDARALSQTF